MLVAICRKPYFKGIKVEIKCIDDAPFEPILAHKVEEKEIAVAEHVRSEHGHAARITRRFRQKLHGSARPSRT